MTTLEKINALERAQQTAKIHFLLERRSDVRGKYHDIFLFEDHPKERHCTSVYYLPDGNEDLKIPIMVSTVHYYGEGGNVGWRNYNKLIADNLIMVIEEIMNNRDVNRLANLNKLEEERENKRIENEKSNNEESQRVREEFSNYIPLKTTK